MLHHISNQRQDMSGKMSVNEIRIHYAWNN